MALNTITALNREIWERGVQMYLSKSTVCYDICRLGFPSLEGSDRVNFPTLSDMYANTYTAGTDITMQTATAVQDYIDLDTTIESSFSSDMLEKTQAFADYIPELSRQAGIALALKMDRDVLDGGVTNAGNSITGGTVDGNTIYDLFTQARTALLEDNVPTDKEWFAVLDPKRVQYLSQALVGQGFTEADKNLRNQFMGNFNDFRVYTSNNLPTSVTLTMDTIPVAGTTFTIAGVTWTFVASGAAAAAGEISIGANVAATKVNFVLAINGTGTPAAATYIDVSQDNRAKMVNAGLSAATFSGDDCVISANGTIAPSLSASAGTNAFGTVTTYMLFGRTGAIALAVQNKPTLTIAQEPKQVAKNYMMTAQYGTTVFDRYKNQLCKISVNY